MGEAKRRAQLAAKMHDELREQAARVSIALRKLSVAASIHFGADCYMHAALGRVLLQDLGLETRVAAGFAAWRVGHGDGDVLGHTPQAQGYLPPGTKGFAYHAWLEGCDCVIDFTTYQLREKARQLDEADGGCTSVEWCPEYLVLPRREIRAYKEVAQAPGPGIAYYEARPDIARLLQAQFTVDEADLRAARLILSNPDIQVFGPNDVGKA